MLFFIRVPVEESGVGGGWSEEVHTHTYRDSEEDAVGYSLTNL